MGIIVRERDRPVVSHQAPQQSLPPPLRQAAAQGVRVQGLPQHDAHGPQHQSSGAAGAAAHANLAQVTAVRATQDHQVVQQSIVQHAPAETHRGKDATHVAVVPDPQVNQVALPPEDAAHVHDLLGHVAVHHLPVPHHPLVEHAAPDDPAEPQGQHRPARHAAKRPRIPAMTMEDPPLVPVDHLGAEQVYVGTAQAYAHASLQHSQLLGGQNHIPGHGELLQDSEPRRTGQSSHITYIVHGQGIAIRQHRVILHQRSAGLGLLTAW